VGQGTFLFPHQQNNALKSLAEAFSYPAMEPYIFAFRIDIATMLQDSASLESPLAIQSWNIIEVIKA
jgi:hypothetical protein